MRALKDVYAGPEKAKCLLVFLPGSGDRAEHFVKKGLVQAVREKQLSVDIIAADATNTYYWQRRVNERLEEDVITPALTAGYQETWLAGNSLGGMGSLRYPRTHPEQIQGVLALSPWLGSLGPEVRKAGGLRAWEPAPPRDDEAFDLTLWRWLKELTVNGAKGPEVWVGWGTRDRLAADDATLAAALPKERVFTTNGGHDWRTWRRLFDAFLQRSSFAERCRPG